MTAVGAAGAPSPSELYNRVPDPNPRHDRLVSYGALCLAALVAAATLLH